MADVRAIMSHGWSICNDIKPETDLEKSLFAADELSGIVWATSLMREQVLPRQGEHAVAALGCPVAQLDDARMTAPHYFIGSSFIGTAGQPDI